VAVKGVRSCARGQWCAPHVHSWQMQSRPDAAAAAGDAAPGERVAPASEDAPGERAAAPASSSRTR